MHNRLDAVLTQPVEAVERRTQAGVDAVQEVHGQVPGGFRLLHSIAAGHGVVQEAVRAFFEDAEIEALVVLLELGPHILHGFN